MPFSVPAASRAAGCLLLYILDALHSIGVDSHGEPYKVHYDSHSPLSSEIFITVTTQLYQLKPMDSPHAATVAILPLGNRRIAPSRQRSESKVGGRMYSQSSCTSNQLRETLTTAFPFVESPDNLVQRSKWNSLSTYIESHFHKPDLEALRCVFAAQRAHFFEGDPVWLFVIGPSGSGKTAIVVKCASAVDRTWVESSITTKSLLSGMADGQKSSLLELIGPSGILIFKDFTTIISKRDEDQKEIISQFREVFDGRFSIRTGQRSAIWEGKITVIAAVTPAIERAWAVHRDLGERFLQVRWFKSDSLQIAAAARLQRGKEKLIGAEMRRLTREFFSVNAPTPQLSDENGERIDTLATVIAQLRGAVTRDKKSHEVIDAVQPEEPTRIAKALDSLVCHHAALFARDVTEDDFRIALRVGFDSVPLKRHLIMSKVALEGSTPVGNLYKATNLADRSIDYVLEELAALNILQVLSPLTGKEVSIHPNFLGLWLQIQPK